MATPDGTLNISPASLFIKRLFDIVLATVGLLFVWWIILLAAFIAWMDTGESGFFAQIRVGRFGRPFRLFKIRTMRSSIALQTNVTTSDDRRITRSGKTLRKWKLDELPQLLNVLVGQMSFVGPRPDVPGYADLLTGEDRAILLLRPGITGPASLYYRNEESALASVRDPEAYNRDVVFPHKVQINLEYMRNYSLIGDIKYILRTVFG